MRTFAIVRGKPPGQRGLVDRSPWGCKESDNVRAFPASRSQYKVCRSDDASQAWDERMSEWVGEIPPSPAPAGPLWISGIWEFLGQNETKLVFFHTENEWFPSPHPTVSINSSCFTLKASSLGLSDHLDRGREREGAEVVKLWPLGPWGESRPSFFRLPLLRTRY